MQPFVSNFCCCTSLRNVPVPLECSRFDTMRSYMLTMWHGAPMGRLLCYDPATASTSVLAHGLWYANGVALSPDESFVAVVETCSMRARRYWLKGPKVPAACGLGVSQCG